MLEWLDCYPIFLFIILCICQILPNDSFSPFFPLPSATEVLRHLVDGVESVELGGLLALHHLPLALEGRQLYVLLCLLGPWLE